MRKFLRKNWLTKVKNMKNWDSERHVLWYRKDRCYISLWWYELIWGSLNFSCKRLESSFSRNTQWLIQNEDIIFSIPQLKIWLFKISKTKREIFKCDKIWEILKKWKWSKNSCWVKTWKWNTNVIIVNIKTRYWDRTKYFSCFIEWSESVSEFRIFSRGHKIPNNYHSLLSLT